METKEAAKQMFKVVGQNQDQDTTKKKQKKKIDRDNALELTLFALISGSFLIFNLLYWSNV